MRDLREFKAWFNGFKENIKKPSEAQWKRVCEEIEKLKPDEPAGQLRIVPASNNRIIPGDPATDPRFTPETMPKKIMSTGAAMDAGVPKKA